MSEHLFNVGDYRQPGKADSQAVRECLTATRNLPHRTIIFSGKDYLLDESILLPSNTTVIIDNCTLRQSDEIFDTLFRGDNLILDPAHPNDFAIDVKPLKNIKILGRGQATLTGCFKNRVMYHPFFKENQLAVGDFWGWRTHLINFSCLDNFEIAGLKITHTRNWAMSFEMSQHGHIHDLHFDTHVKNGDGIDFRKGCSHMLVENITGFTSDDTVACTALRGEKNPPLSRYLYTSEPAARSFFDCDLRQLDIHDIVIRNLEVGGNNHAVICLSAGGTQVHHVTIENIRERKYEGERERFTALVSVYTGYGTGYTAGDLHHISLAKIVADHSRKAAVDSNADVTHCTIEAARNLGTGPQLELQFPKGWTVKP